MKLGSWRIGGETPGKAAEPELLEIVRTQRLRSGMLMLVSLLLTVTAFALEPPATILHGMGRILVEPGVLITDYMAVAGPGAAFLNSGLLLAVGLLLVRMNRIAISGPVIAALLTLCGFSFFGKNLYNSWAVPLGVLVYARFTGAPFSRYILHALFGTALGPLTSQISFGLGLPPQAGIPLGNLAGMVAGFLLPVLAGHFLKFHQGYNLYNIGFTCGIIGMLFMGVLRAFGYQSTPVLVVSEGLNLPLAEFMYLLSIALIIGGLLTGGADWGRLWLLWRQSGRLAADFPELVGIGTTMVNMGLLGLLATTYALVVGGELNGPILGGIFTIIGFGAFGKHLMNTLPILVGVYLAALMHVFDPHATASLLAALFGTTLAPMAGAFGWPVGLLAGFLHMSMVMNIGYLHGGLNLYNNGFSGGFIAAVLVPVLEAVRERMGDQNR